MNRFVGYQADFKRPTLNFIGNQWREQSSATLQVNGGDFVIDWQQATLCHLHDKLFVWYALGLCCNLIKNKISSDIVKWLMTYSMINPFIPAAV